MSDIRSIQGALPFIARALGNSLGVQVKQGQRAETDGNTIYLPPLSQDDAVYQGRQFSAYELAKVLGIGKVIHEATHIRYTNFSVWFQSVELPILAGVLNILEDIRCESKIAQDFPGTANDLQQMTEVLSLDGFWESAKDDDHPSAIMQSWMLYKLRHDVLGQIALANILAETDSVFKKTVPVGVAIKLEALMFKVQECKSTQDCAELGLEIIKMIEDESKKEEEKEPEDGSDDSGNQNDQQTDDGQSNSSNDQSNGSQDAGTDPGNSGDDQPGQDGNSSQGVDDQPGDSVLKKILNAGKDDGIDDLGETLSNFLNSVSDSSGVNVVANTIDDKAMGPDLAFSGTVATAVNALKHRLHILMQSQSRSRVLSCSMGNKIRSSKLHTAKLGGSIFARKIRATKVNTAVKLLLDVSPSMSKDDRIGVARQAAFALASSLEAVNGVSVSVSTFPDSDGNWLAVKNLNRFGESLRNRVVNFSSLSTKGSTPLAESLSAVGYEIAAQPESRKIVMVITDGEPNDESAAMHVIRKLEISGIETCGLGIMMDVSHLFHRHASIDSIDQLSGAMFAMIQDVLLMAA